MIVAHVAGVPFEEWIPPVVAAGSGMVVALRAAFRRLRQRS